MVVERLILININNMEKEINNNAYFLVFHLKFQILTVKTKLSLAALHELINIIITGIYLCICNIFINVFVF